MTGPIHFDIFKNITGSQRIGETDNDKGAIQPKPQDTQPAAIEMNVGQDIEPELEIADPEKFKNQGV